MAARHDTAADLVKAISGEVKVRRHRHRWTLDELAKRAGLSKSYVWAIEKGDAANPTVDTALRLSRALGCSMDELIGETSGTVDLHPDALRIACDIDQLLRGNQKRKRSPEQQRAFERAKAIACGRG